jgi:hypothetical protein
MGFMACTNQPNQEKSLLTTDTIFFYADSSYEFATFNGSQRHGTSRTFRKNIIYRENLYVNNRILVERRFYLEDRGHARKILYNIGDTLWPIGVLWYQKNTLEKKQVNAIYFEVKAKDTVEYGDSNEIRIIGNLGTSKRFNMKLKLGQLDSYGNLIELDTTYKTNNTELAFKVGGLKEGVNLITGHLYYYDNSEDITNRYMGYKMMKIEPKYELPYIFYHQVYVRSSSNRAK